MAPRPATTWYGAADNYSNANRPASDPINKIIVHVTQGSWSSALNWFANPSSDVSAHYTVRSSDGKIGQSVQEEDIAWHCGWWAYNRTSIGIEHEGYVANPDWFTDAMYRSSARLSAYLCDKYRIPIDRNHIIGHNEVPGCSGPGGGAGCHTDPGRYWNWTRYINLVKSYAGSGGPYTQTVDNASPRFSASSRWGTSSYYSGAAHGNNYRVLKKPLSVGDNAKFKIKTPARAKYAVYARWPADPGYNYQTTFFIQGINGWNREVRSQRANGGKWVFLGDYTFPKGDANRIQISSKSPAKGYIVADAVRIVRR